MIRNNEMPLYRWTFGDFDFDEAQQRLRMHGREVPVEAKPLLVLAELLRDAGNVITKQELLDSVWEGRETVENVVATAIAKLRGALGSAGPELIATVHRKGYRFTGSAERHAIGVRMSSRLDLSAGYPISGRPHMRLQRLIDQSPGSEVWLAAHAKTGEQRVYKFALDAEHLAQLRRESSLSRILRDSLGDRDDIVRIIDWDFASEPFFLESEYGGRNLAEWAADEPDLLAWTRVQRLGFFLQIADAVVAAHGAGVLHKDLKPGNVLVRQQPDGGWRIALADFGSGQLLNPERLASLGAGSTGFTQGAIDRAGTPLYVAPEILQGRSPSMLSDLYALGILLYQVAVADIRKPLAPGWEHDIDDPLLRDDIARATDGDPARRLSSAAELAERLRRLPLRNDERGRALRLDQERLRASEALERTRQRRPWIVALVVVLALAVAGSLGLYASADRARKLAQQESARSEAVLRFLQEDVLHVADPAGPAGNPRIGDLLDLATTRLDRDTTDPRIRGEIRTLLAKSYEAMNRIDKAEEGYRRAADDFLAVLPADAPEVLINRYDQVRKMAESGRFDEAEALLARTDDEAGRWLESETEVALNATMAKGIVHYQRMRAAPMLDAFLNAERLRQIVRPDDKQLRFGIAELVVEARLRSDDATTAEADLRQLLKDVNDLEPGVTKATVARVHQRLSRSLRMQDRLPEALEHAREALGILEEVRGKDEESTIFALSTLSSIYDRMRDCTAALPIARDVVDRQRRVSPPPSAQARLIETGNLGFKEHECGDAERGVALIREADDGLRAAYGDDNVPAQSLRYYLIKTLIADQRYPEAGALLDTLSATALRASSPRPGWQERLRIQHNKIRIHNGEHAEGLAGLAEVRAKLVASGTNSEDINEIDQFVEGVDTISP